MTTELRIQKCLALQGAMLSSSLIEVFVHSHDKNIDVGHYREMSYHWECGVAQWAYAELADQFKGRILSQQDVTALQQVFEMAKKESREVKVYDTSRITDRIRALKNSVLKTPTVLIDGKRYQGLDEISRLILKKQNL
jgi:hypothetical protein